MKWAVVQEEACGTINISKVNFDKESKSEFFVVGGGGGGGGGVLNNNSMPEEKCQMR